MPVQKKSGNVLNAWHIYIYIYIYIKLGTSSSSKQYVAPHNQLFGRSAYLQLYQYHNITNTFV